MKTILISALVLILLAGCAMLFRDGYIKRKYRKLATLRYNSVAPIILKLDAKEDVTQSEVAMLVKNPALRHVIFRILEKYKRNDLFPAEYFTREKGAEGFLVNWLEFPTELGKAPDEIEFLTIVTILESEALDYYVFKYKTKTPRWAEEYNWMLGVSGPYRNSSLPYDVPRRVFSRFNTLDSISPEREVQWVHQNISQT